MLRATASFWPIPVKLVLYAVSHGENRTAEWGRGFHSEHRPNVRFFKAPFTFFAPIRLICIELLPRSLHETS